MRDLVIEVDGLGKQYVLGAYGTTTLREALGTVLSPFRRARPQADADALAAARGDKSFWALRDVTFEIERAAIVGFIGPNGAGKSTILKILSRITWPTTGQVVIRGRVASLLEVGTGFHPDLTGRDNVYLNGAILGMSRSEIRQRFDDIVSFAEVERFIDTPVKRYSSGMYIRLAFAVAAHLESEILIVDEALAVGDAAFQRKCLARIDQAARSGRTVIFVSHNMGAVESLCSRCILIQDGRKTAEGAPRDVISTYLGYDWRPMASWKRQGGRPSAEVEFTRLCVSDPAGRIKGTFTSAEPIRVAIEYHVRESLPRCQVAARINNRQGITVMTTAEPDADDVPAVAKEPGHYTATFDIPAGLLAPDGYSLQIAAHSPMEKLFEVLDDIVSFTIAPEGSLTLFEGRHGFVTPRLSWTVTSGALASATV